MRIKKIFIILFLLVFKTLIFTGEIDSKTSSTMVGDKVKTDNILNNTPEKEEKKEELLYLKIEEENDKKHYSTVKNYYFYKGNREISREEFSKILNDQEVNKFNDSLKKIKFENIVSSTILGGLAFSFFIPSLIFVITATTYSSNSSINSNYSNYLEFYKSNYDYVILPGLISIFLTFSFTMATFINMGVHFYRYYAFRNNSKIYEDAIKRYNEKISKKILPDIGFKTDYNGENICEISLLYRFR